MLVYLFLLNYLNGALDICLFMDSQSYLSKTSFSEDLSYFISIFYIIYLFEASEILKRHYKWIFKGITHIYIFGKACDSRVEFRKRRDLHRICRHSSCLILQIVVLLLLSVSWLSWLKWLLHPLRMKLFYLRIQIKFLRFIIILGTTISHLVSHTNYIEYF